MRFWIWHKIEVLEWIFNLDVCFRWEKNDEFDWREKNLLTEGKGIRAGKFQRGVKANEIVAAK